MHTSHSLTSRATHNSHTPAHLTYIRHVTGIAWITRVKPRISLSDQVLSGLGFRASGFTISGFNTAGFRNLSFRV